MTIRTLLAGPVALLLVVATFVLPVAAQSTCSDCVGGGSDIAGALFQGDATTWATAEARSQLDERATALNTLSSDVATSTVAPAVADAFAAAPSARALLMHADVGSSVKSDLQNEWTARGLPAPEAEALISALAGLTAQNRVDPEALQVSLAAYNTAVEAASPTFVTDPAPSFLALRYALAILTQDAP